MNTSPRSWRRRAADRDETGQERRARLTEQLPPWRLWRGRRRARKTTANPFPRGTAGWERPRSGGEDGDAHRHPPRCRSRHAEMGGRSQPRPRWPDRHRRSGGRGATASSPATCGTGGVHTGRRFPCTSTPMWDVHARIGIGSVKNASKSRLRHPQRSGTMGCCEPRPEPSSPLRAPLSYELRFL